MYSAILLHRFNFLTKFSRSNIKEAGDQVTIFNSEAIETDPLVSLSREALFLWTFSVEVTTTRSASCQLFLLKISLSY